MYNLLNEIDQKLAQQVASMTPVKPEDLGLDMRSFGTAYTDSYDYLIIKKIDDKSLRYYGGFEYTNECDRQEYGDYVIYSSSATRVYDALEAFRELQNEEIV